MIKKLLRFTLGAFTLLTAIILAFSLISNITKNLFTDIWVIIAPLLIVTAIVIPPTRTKLIQTLSWVFTQKKVATYTGIGLLVLSLVVRFAFLWLSYEPVSDPATFLTMAQRLATDGGLLHNIYVGLFPYTIPYDLLLSGSLAIFSNKVLAIIALNTVFDVIGIVAVYSIAHYFTRKQHTSILFTGVYATLPFTIFFIPLSLPVVAVNAFIIASLAGFLYLIRAVSQQNNKQILIYSLTTGLSLAVLNWFRPFTIIFIIAIIVWYVLYVIRKKSLKQVKIITASVAIFIGLYIAGGMAFSALASHITGYSKVGGSGWSLYLGANKDTYGGWNQTDKNLQLELGKKHHEPSIVQATFTRLAIDRYLALSPMEFANLMVHKFVTLSGDMKNVTYNLRASYPAIANHQTVDSAIMSINLITIVALLCAVIHLLLRTKPKVDYSLFLIITFSGLYVSSLLLEVINRYFLPFIPLLFVLMLSLLASRKNTMTKIK